MAIAQPNAPGPISLDFDRLLRPLVRHAWLPICGVILGGAAAAFLAARSPKIYAGREVVQVAQEAHQVIDFKNDNTEDFKSSEVLKTIEQTLSAGSLLLRVVRVNHLERNADFAPPKPDGARYTDAELIERMEGKVSVNLRRGTRLIDIVVEDRDPVLAAQLARSIVEEYRLLSNDQKLAARKDANEFLLKEEATLKAKLTDSENKLNAYREEHKAVSLDDKQNIVVDKLRELSAKVTEAKGKRLQWEADIGKMQPLEGKSTEELLTLSSINSVPGVAALRQQINEREGAFAAIKERYGPKHIKYIEANETLQKLNAALAEEVRKAAEAATQSYQSGACVREKPGSGATGAGGAVAAARPALDPVQGAPTPGRERSGVVRERAHPHEGDRHRAIGRSR